MGERDKEHYTFEIVVFLSSYLGHKPNNKKRRRTQGQISIYVQNGDNWLIIKPSFLSHIWIRMEKDSSQEQREDD